MNPENAHAIVVGVERYDDIPGGSWTLNGPAVDAARFVSWLRDRLVPPGNIRLFANPIDGNKPALEALDVGFKSADSKTITDALADDIAKRQGELLFVFWGGHGVVAEDERRLFFSDVRENLLRNLNIETLLYAFRTTLFPGFANQVFFFDACANYFELQQSPVNTAQIDIPAGTPRAGVKQFVLFSSAVGERSANNSAMSTGLFSLELREALKASGTQWPPDLPMVEGRLKERFKELTAQGKANQTPVHFYYQDWAGSKGVLYPSDHANENLRELVDALSACPLMQTPASRVRILGDVVGGRAADRIKFHQDTKTHVEIIVASLFASRDLHALIRQVTSREDKGASLDALRLAHLEFRQQLFNRDVTRQVRDLLKNHNFPEADLLRLFAECAGGLILDARQDLADPYLLMLTLADFGPLSDRFPYPALLFAEKLAVIASQPVAEVLREIVDRVAAQHNVSDAVRDFRTGAKWQSFPGRTTFIFELKPKANGFVIRAFLLNSSGQWSALKTDDNPVSEMDARKKFSELLSEIETTVSTNLLVEVVLPRELLCEPVDRWTFDYGGFPAAVGAHYPVVVRWLNRLHDSKMQPRWRQRWQLVSGHPCNPYWLKQVDQHPTPQSLFAALDNPAFRGTFVSFAYPPSRLADPRGDALSVALSAGTPIAVWWRECDPNPTVAQNDLQAVLTHKSLDELPDLLRDVRNLAEQSNNAKHPGFHLSILFDSHDHRPPQLGD